MHSEVKQHSHRTRVRHIIQLKKTLPTKFSLDRIRLVSSDSDFRVQSWWVLWCIWLQPLTSMSIGCHWGHDGSVIVHPEEQRLLVTWYPDDGNRLGVMFGMYVPEYLTRFITDLYSYIGQYLQNICGKVWCLPAIDINSIYL